MQFRLPILVPILVPVLALAACQSAETISSETPSDDAAMESSASSAAVTDAEFTGRTTAFDQAQSSITFTGQSNIINHEGSFPDFRALLILNTPHATNLTHAQLAVTIDMTTVTADGTGVGGHLKREDFFDVENHPQATFVSTAITQKGGDLYTITGDLTIKGITQSITTDATITDSTLQASFDVPRRDFGIGNDSYGNKLLDPMVPVAVNLVFEGELTNQ